MSGRRDAGKCNVILRVTVTVPPPPPPPKEWLPDVLTIEVDGPEGWSAGSMLWRSMKKNRAGIQPRWSR